MGSGRREGRAGRAVARVWAAPVSIVGAADRAVRRRLGRERARRGRRARGGRRAPRPLLTRGIPWFPISAITLGHVVLARRSARASTTAAAHERIHVAQYERWGILFPLLYLAASLGALLDREGRVPRQRVRARGASR